MVDTLSLMQTPLRSRGGLGCASYSQHPRAVALPSLRGVAIARREEERLAVLHVTGLQRRRLHLHGVVHRHPPRTRREES